MLSQRSCSSAERRPTRRYVLPPPLSVRPLRQSDSALIFANDAHTAYEWVQRRCTRGRMPMLIVSSVCTTSASFNGANCELAVSDVELCEMGFARKVSRHSTYRTEAYTWWATCVDFCSNTIEITNEPESSSSAHAIIMATKRSCLQIRQHALNPYHP